MVTDHEPLTDEARDFSAEGGRPRSDGGGQPPSGGPAFRLVRCSVTGSPTVRSRAEADGDVRRYGGSRHYFCCGGCAALFDADPQAYCT